MSKSDNMVGLPSDVKKHLDDRFKVTGFKTRGELIEDMLIRTSPYDEQIKTIINSLKPGLEGYAKYIESDLTEDEVLRLVALLKRICTLATLNRANFEHVKKGIGETLDGTAYVQMIDSNPPKTITREEFNRIR